jgi:hypothetical protein
MTKIKRWALQGIYNRQLYARFPRRGEELYSSRREAVAAKMSGSLYTYKAVRVELRVTNER